MKESERFDCLCQIVRCIVKLREDWPEFSIAAEIDVACNFFDAVATPKDGTFGNERYVRLSLRGDLIEYVYGK